MMPSIASPSFRRPLRDWPRYWLLAFAVASVGWFATWMIYRQAVASFDSRMTAEFGNEVDDAEKLLLERVRAYSDYLSGVQALFQTSADVTRAEFKAYLDSVGIARRYPGLQVTAFTRRVDNGNRAAFEDRVRQDRSVNPQGYPNFRIKPAGERAEYFVAEYVEPLVGNEALLGFDQGSEVTRRAAVHAVRDSGKLTASGRITLVQDASRPVPMAGFQLRLPVYRSGMPTSTAEQRQAAFIGLVGSALRADELLRHAIPENLHRNLHIRVHDAGPSGGMHLPVDDKVLLFDSLKVTDAPRVPTLRHAGGFVTERIIPIADRHWRMHYTWSRPLPPGGAIGQIVLVAGTAISLLLAGLALAYARSRHAVRELHTKRTALEASEARLRALTDLSADWYWETDDQSRFTTISGGVVAGTGLSIDSHLGKCRWELPSFGVSDETWAEHRRQIERREPFVLVMGRPGPSGWVEYVRITGEPLFDSRGEFCGYRGIGTNITQERQDELRMRMENALNQILSSAPGLEDAIGRSVTAIGECMGWACGAYWVLDQENNQFACHHQWAPLPAHREFYEYYQLHPLEADRHGVIGGAWFRQEASWVRDVAHEPGFQRRDRALVAGLRTGFAFPLVAHGDRVIGVFEYFSPVELSRNAFFVSLSESAATLLSQYWQRRTAEARLQYAASHDSLTGLPNRTEIHRTLGQALARAQRTGHAVDILFIDLDRFKQINDAHGHAVGDGVLQEVARRLTDVVRESDVVGRLGGDEFVLVTEGGGNPDDCAALANRALQALALPLHIAGADYVVAASIGIARYPHDGSETATLLRNADTAMYRAKGQGRGMFAFYDERMTLESTRRLELERDLHLAVQRREFVLAYQPKVSADGKDLHGVEALVRWQHPMKGLLLPEVFISIAEDSGLIRQLGAWVLREAVAQLARWRLAQIAVNSIAVNISARQFADDGLPELLTALLAEHGLPGDALELEITETLIMHDPDRAVGILHSIRKLGIAVSIDDLGTGFSSLAYLRKFPISAVKLDRSFVAGIPESPDDAAIVRSLIGLGHSLGLSVVAEGVESEAQRTFLAAQDCDSLQGYLFARPMSPEAVTQFLQGLSAKRQSGLPGSSAEPVN